MIYSGYCLLPKSVVEKVKYELFEGELTEGLCSRLVITIQFVRLDYAS
jgi:hypothetical protein